MNDPKDLAKAVNDASGQAAVMNLLVMALIAQVPDRAKLLKDFAEMAEDTTIRAIYSSKPEAFFQAAQAAVHTWTEVIQMDEDDERQG
ncbi:hypothetical protein ABIC63_002098 [Pseudacidovorax sp. 1753]|uniref:hypothetical protein n=1 Tax=Pseudacidovorax sp. 1753 TaxID=3156419 RepID=UPI0033918F8F